MAVCSASACRTTAACPEPGCARKRWECRSVRPSPATAISLSARTVASSPSATHSAVPRRRHWAGSTTRSISQSGPSDTAPIHSGLVPEPPDLDALLETLRERVESRRRGEIYPPGLEEELDGHFAHLAGDPNPPHASFLVEDLEAARAELDAYHF